MTTLIEIACLLLKEETVQALIEKYCQEKGNQLIGRSVYEEIGEVLLVVQVLHLTNVSKFVAILSHALHQGIIASFEYVTCDLATISSDPSLDLQKQMHDFPLSPGQSWFPAIHDSHQVYLYTSRPVLSPKQIVWLLEHKMEWA